jgi:hypothetical protein
MIGSYVNFLPTTTLKRTTLKRFKDNENILKYSFKFMSTNMLSIRTRTYQVNIVDFTISTLSLILRPFNNNSYLYFIDFIGVTTHIGPVEETRTNFGFIKIHEIWLLIE